MEKYSDDTPIKDLPLSKGAKNALKRFRLADGKYATVFGHIKTVSLE